MTMLEGLPRRGCRNVGHPASITLSGLVESSGTFVDPGCASRPWAVLFDPFGVSASPDGHRRRSKRGRSSFLNTRQ